VARLTLHAMDRARLTGDALRAVADLEAAWQRSVRLCRDDQLTDESAAIWNALHAARAFVRALEGLPTVATLANTTPRPIQ